MSTHNGSSFSNEMNVWEEMSSLYKVNRNDSTFFSTVISVFSLSPITSMTTQYWLTIHTRSNILHQMVCCYYCCCRSYRCLICSLLVITVCVWLSLSPSSEKISQLEIEMWILQTHRHIESMFIRKQLNSSYNWSAKGRWKHLFEI